MGGLFVVVDLTVNRDDTPTSGVFCSRIRSPVRLFTLSSISVFVNGPPAENGVAAYSNPKQNARSMLAIFAFFTVCCWSLYTAKYSAKMEAIKVSPPDLKSQSLKIFTYKLPKRFNHDLLAKIKKNKKRYAGYQDQLAEATIYAELLKSPVRTKDPKEADLFFVPVFAAASVSQLVHKPQQREHARVDT